MTNHIRICALAFIASFSCVILAGTQTFAEPEEIAGVNSEESTWSPDGSKLAFDGSRGDRFFNIYVLELTSKKLTRLTDTRANDITPAWSPNGRFIAFTSDRTGKNEIYIMPSEGGPARQVTHNNSDSIHAFWSPDGRRLIYCSARLNPNQAEAAEGEVYDIFTINADGTQQEQLTANNGINTYPNYSPDGTRILYRHVLGKRNSEVWVMNADGSGAKNLTNHPSFDAWPFWSPDGKQIVFASNRRTNGESYDIYIMNADGSGLKQITSVPGRNTSPKWSPNGKTITFDQSHNRTVRVLLIEVS